MPKDNLLSVFRRKRAGCVYERYAQLVLELCTVRGTVVMLECGMWQCTIVKRVISTKVRDDRLRQEVSSPFYVVTFPAPHLDSLRHPLGH